jgi:uncharacterized protein YigE (DUF2233 family)
MPIGFLRDDGQHIDSIHLTSSRSALGIFEIGEQRFASIDRVLHTKSGKIYYRITSGYDWKKAIEAVQGGPRLVQDGKVVFGTQEHREGFKPDVLKGANRRTVVGLDADGNVMVLVFNKDIGLKDAAEAMKRKNAVHAFNLDGGTSTTLIEDGKLRLYSGRYPPVYLAGRK